MDIYSFIDSMEIAEHCRSIGQTWMPFEMAAIKTANRKTNDDMVWMSRISPIICDTLNHKEITRKGKKLKENYGG